MRLDALSYRVLFSALKNLGLQTGAHPIIWKDSQIKYEFPTHLLSRLTEKERQNVWLFKKELDVLSKIYSYLPSELDDRFWLKIAQCDHMKERFDALKFMKLKERQREKDMARKEKCKSRQIDENDLVPGYNNYSETPYLADATKLALHANYVVDSRSVRAYQLEDRPAVAVDCRFLQDHSQRGLALTFVQMNYLFGRNKKREHPWRLDFVNFDDSIPLLRDGRKRYLRQFESEKRFSGRLTSESYLDLHNKEDIIYLSPHTDNVLSPEEVLDPRKCFVIGGIVDRVKEHNIHPEASALVGQQEDIKLRRLPLELMDWKSGSQLLTFTAVLDILQRTFEANGDFKQALEKTVPRRHFHTMKEAKPMVFKKYENIREYERNILRLVGEHTRVPEIGENLPRKWEWF